MAQNDSGLVKGPDSYSHEELKIASEELRRAASGFLASGVEFASYPVKVGRTPPRWVKFIGANQLSRAAVGFAQLVKDHESAGAALRAIADNAARLQQKIEFYESVNRLDHLKLAIFGRTTVKTAAGEVEFKA